MNNRKVAHAWAGQQKPRATGSHYFFEGPSIFSYGRHFEIARHVTGVKGARAVLFTTRDYSMTTQRHKSYTRGALTGYDVFYVPRVDAAAFPSNHAENLRHYVQSAKEAHEKARKAMSWGKMYGAEEAALIRAGAQYLDFFGRAVFAVPEARKLARELRDMERQRKAGKLWTAAEMAVLDAREARAKAAQDRRREASRLRAARWNEEYLGAQMAAEIERPAKVAAARAVLEKWKAGESDELPGYEYEKDFPTALRINADGTRVETSRGAEITTRTARILWEALTTGRDVVGQELDGFAVRSWDGVSLVVGCHEIPAGELVRMAAALELDGALPEAPYAP